LVRFDVSVNSQGKVYLPLEIRRELGSKDLEILGDTKAIVIFPRGTRPSDVLRSLEVVQLDLKHLTDLSTRRRPTEKEASRR
jgi:bifunctional DNA-binding transcriptional regulator/antitoxin component of YhaV-PrlF toxin-antitoxin module